ncbi:MAG: hypothetical protein A7316_02195 [Candidatus Altiarchaeales archaeon WOR_SM1_86-2]|nr:MAG: hypothetical protein A7316_02195 [Candidatus Altiarchaeales archaeon WOR_SM1_86-2]
MKYFFSAAPSLVFFATLSPFIFTNPILLGYSYLLIILGIKINKNKGGAWEEGAGATLRSGVGDTMALIVSSGLT